MKTSIHVVHYLWYVLQHKWYVFFYMAKYGLYYQGLMHDMSKFHPSEFMAYVRFFEEQGAAKHKGFTVHEIADKRIMDEFNRARDLHKHRNPHHWEYWVHNGMVEDIPEEIAIEMVCDWKSVARVLRHTGDALPWYIDQKDNILLSKRTRQIVEYEILHKEKEAA